MKKCEEKVQYLFEEISCYYCGSSQTTYLLTAQEDLTGKPGEFTFVTCSDCGLTFQNPRIAIEQIKDFYDNEYIAHRKKKDWGALTPVYNWAMEKHDREKVKIVNKYLRLNSNSQALDIGCAAGTFLLKLNEIYNCNVSGVDFKNLSKSPGFEVIEFYHGLFYEQEMEEDKFDLITMWHFLEHDYDPIRSLKYAKDLLAADGFLVIEVPRLDSTTYRLYGSRWPGLQAPQHTILFTKKMIINFANKAGLKIVNYLSYGAFPAYFYLFTGLAFKILKGKGLDLDKVVVPYFAGQLLTFPILIFEKYLNLSMQTIICKKA